MDQIHKCVQVFLHSCNTTGIEEMESGDLAEFGGLHKKVERGEWLTLKPGWVDRPAQKAEGRQKSVRYDIRASPIGGGGGRNVVLHNGVDPQLRIMEIL